MAEEEAKEEKEEKKEEKTEEPKEPKKKSKKSKGCLILILLGVGFLVLVGFINAMISVGREARLSVSEQEQETRESSPLTPTSVVEPSPTEEPMPESTIVLTPEPTLDVESAVTTPSQLVSPPPQTSTGGCKYSCSGPDRDCSDFTTQAEAQAFFNCCGFTATNDPMRLDSVGVGDGIPCESLP